MLPFTTDQFLQVFSDYNRAVWPLQLALLGLGITLSIVGYLGPPRAARWISLGLAVLWGWMGAVYHLDFFRRLTPAALAFGIAFLVQAGLFVLWGLRHAPGDTGRVRGPQAWLGAILLGYAFLGYPVIAWALGHRYPAMPTFGLPCPTTITTLALLVWVSPRPRWWLLVIPFLWAGIGTTAAFTLGIREDLGLLASAVIAGSWLTARWAHEFHGRERQEIVALKEA